MDLIKTGHKVRHILECDEKARDCDLRLACLIWLSEAAQQNITQLEGFFEALQAKRLEHFESIRRVRQKLQEKHQHLRGKLYEQRHGQEGHINEQLTFFDRWG